MSPKDDKDDKADKAARAAKSENPERAEKAAKAKAEKAERSVEAEKAGRAKAAANAAKAEAAASAKPKAPKETEAERKPARIKISYVKEVVPRLMKEREYPNVMAVPRLKKVVVNMGVARPPRTSSSWTRPWTSWGGSPASGRPCGARASRSRPSSCARACPSRPR